MRFMNASRRLTLSGRVLQYPQRYDRFGSVRSLVDDEGDQTEKAEDETVLVLVSDDSLERRQRTGPEPLHRSSYTCRLPKLCVAQRISN